MNNLNRKTDKTDPLHTISIGYFLQIRLFTEKHSLTTAIHPGIFHGRALFKQQSVSIEELSADSAPRKFAVLKTNICIFRLSGASRANMLVLRTSNFQGATIRLIVPRHNSFHCYNDFRCIHGPSG